MRVVFHIGMGKTGTTAIQSALTSNGARLAEQKARYLGMWFESVDARFEGYAGFDAFCAADPEAQKAHAATFAKVLRRMQRRTEAEIFIMSNEGLWGAGRKLTPFFTALSRKVDLSFVAYMRPMRSWLPSAFTQWGIRHKARPGPIAPFEPVARRLMGQYGVVRHWQESFGDRLDLRLFDKGIDVVEDFATAAGIALDAPGERLLERLEPAEAVLRGLFNDRFAEAVLPGQFNAVLKGPAPRRASDMARLCFGREGLEEIVAENAELIEHVRKTQGIDLGAPAGAEEAAPDPEALRDRLIDFLIEIAIQQSMRIRRLEREVQQLSGTPRAEETQGQDEARPSGDA